MNRLADAFPRLAALPRAGLIARATPIEPLAAVDGVHVKRDDLSAADYGGNKIRKLDFLLADAVARRRRELTVFGYAGSNFVAATSWHARKLGLHTIAGLLPQRAADYVVDNLSISLHCGSTLFVRDRDAALAAEALARTLRSLVAGRLPYWIPPGGSNALGALGFVDAAFELRAQIDADLMPRPAALYVPFSSMGTVAGLCVGLALAGLPVPIMAVQVVGDRHAGRTALLRLLSRLVTLLKRYGVVVAEPERLLAGVTIRSEFFGGEYARATPAVDDAIDRFVTASGARADSAYSGKALACLYADLLRPGRRAPMLYWHTFSASALPPDVSRASAGQAPPALRCYWN
ncbi:1-aminocyclopropane-1-carboxylate deaminase/D-cysteine desulfhydrase [Solimonas terrae]|uniref:Pyridoxal-phosphate dependent enzyme n=1 Tax=Solimonas terrae TaxID=1396819 RepID=A0A6M2BUV9_9GAMM|nr:pyridoxal-phosphate dependent enzyme [Solimonas terrae]NGY06268.1 pyridoxal-phosphate dependent enzyme [Solimonas terrae]